MCRISVQRTGSDAMLPVLFYRKGERFYDTEKENHPGGCFLSA